MDGIGICFVLSITIYRILNVARIESWQKENDGVAYFTESILSIMLKSEDMVMYLRYDQVLNSDQDELLAKARDDR